MRERRWHRRVGGGSITQLRTVARATTRRDIRRRGAAVNLHRRGGGASQRIGHTMVASTRRGHCGGGGGAIAAAPRPTHADPTAVGSIRHRYGQCDVGSGADPPQVTAVRRRGGGKFGRCSALMRMARPPPWQARTSMDMEEWRRLPPRCAVVDVRSKLQQKFKSCL